MPTVAHADFPGAVFFEELSAIVATPVAVASTSTFSFDRQRQHVTVVDTQAGLVRSGSVLNRFSVPAEQTWANCEVDLATSQPTIFTYIEQQGMAPVFAGGAAINGISARHFTFSNGNQKSAAPGFVAVDYFDDAATHTPLRVAINLAGVQVMFIDILNFTSLVDAAPPEVQWPGPMPDEASLLWDTTCPGAVVVPAGAALYPGSPPLGVSTSFQPQSVLVSSSSTTSSEVMAGGVAGRRLLGYVASSPPRPPPPPTPPPPPPCPSLITTTWSVCYKNVRDCSIVVVTQCQNITTVAVGAANYTQVPAAAPTGRRLHQVSTAFFLGKLLASYDSVSKTYHLSSEPLLVNASFSRWPTAAQNTCLQFYSNDLAACQQLAANLSSTSDGMIALQPDAGTLSLPYTRNGANGNNTYIGLTGGATTLIVPPRPGYPFDTSQFPVTSCTKSICWVARVWWFVEGPYKQNMFVFIHVNVPLPCVATGGQCGNALSFDLVNDNVFLSLVSSSSNVGAPPAPAGAWTPVGCRGPLTLPRSYAGNSLSVGTGASLSDCLNQATALGWLYAGLSVCAGGDTSCRTCRGCSGTDIAYGACNVAANNVVQYNNASAADYPCDPMGGVVSTSTGYNYITFLCAFAAGLVALRH